MVSRRMLHDGAEIGAKSSPIPARAGIGLRFQHHQAVLDTHPAIGWFEIHPENYFGGGSPLTYLERVRRDYPLSCHGVGLSLGSAQGVDRNHLADLLPLPMTEEALGVVCRNTDAVQTRLRCRILVENPSSYPRYRHSTIPEWEFLAAVARKTGCGILCDVNNIYVSAANHGWQARAYLDALPAHAFGEIHLAGH